MEFIGEIEEALGKPAQKEFLDLQPGDVPATYADIDDLVEDAGFKPSTPLAAGIQRFVAWYQGYYGQDRRP
jgi:UDP-glucuronate 4-epimerase